MTIWFDFANSPQVVFFAKIIRKLKEKHTIIITCRPLANTIELLELEKFDFTVVGSHYGVSSLGKILGVFWRIFLLWKFFRKINFDVAVSHSSFYLQIVSKIFGKKSIYLNDNEHAAWNKLAIRFSALALFPEPLKEIISTRGWNKLGRIELYPGIKECVYLWDYNNENRNSSAIPRIYIRTEPWNADYYNGRLFFFDDVIIELAKKYIITILPRGEGPVKHYSQPKFDNINVQKKSIPQYEIFNNCDIFIGAGGSMTREAAAVGIPTISIYQDELLAVDHYLINILAMTHTKNLSVQYVDQVLNTYPNKHNSRNEILSKGIVAFNMIINNIENIVKY